MIANMELYDSFIIYYLEIIPTRSVKIGPSGKLSFRRGTTIIIPGWTINLSSLKFILNIFEKEIQKETVKLLFDFKKIGFLSDNELQTDVSYESLI